MPTFASTSRTALRYIAEATPGVTPTAGPHNALRYTGESLNLSISTESSKEIRSDRQTTDLIQVGASVAGGINVELSYKEYDAWLAAALQGNWGTVTNTAISATLTANTLTAGAAAFANVSDGQWIKLSGASNPANNGWFRVLSKASSTVLNFAPGTFAAEGPTANVQVASCRLANGTTMPFFSVEQQFEDIDQYQVFRGCAVNKLSLSMSSGGIVTGSFDLLGMSAGINPSSAMPGRLTPSQTYDVMNAVVGVGQMWEGGAPLTSTVIKSLSLDINNNLRGQEAIGVLGYAGVAAGSLSVTGKLEAYFADASLYTKFLNNTATSLSLRVQDGAGNGYVIQLPRVKYSGGGIDAGAINQDAMVSLDFTALMDSASGKMILIDKN